MKETAALLLLLILAGCQSAAPNAAPPEAKIEPVAVPPETAQEVDMIDVVSITASGDRRTGRLPFDDLKAADDVVFDEKSGLYCFTFYQAEEDACTIPVCDNEGRQIAVTTLPKSEKFHSYFASFEGKICLAVTAPRDARSLWMLNAKSKEFERDEPFSGLNDDAIDLIEAKERRKLLNEIRPEFPIPAVMPLGDGPHGSPSLDPHQWIAIYPVLSGSPLFPRVDFSNDRKLMGMASRDFFAARKLKGKEWARDLLRQTIARRIGIDPGELAPTDVQVRGQQVVFGLRIASRPTVFRTAICRWVRDDWSVEIVPARYIRAL